MKEIQSEPVLWNEVDSLGTEQPMSLGSEEAGDEVLEPAMESKAPTAPREAAGGEASRREAAAEEAVICTRDDDDQQSLFSSEAGSIVAKMASAPRNSAVDGVEDEEGADLGSAHMAFVLELHCAELQRSFSCMGRMDPYAVVTAEGRELMRTPPHRRGHISAEWNAELTLAEGLPESLPNSITIAVCHRNSLRKEVSCGSVEIPVTADMGWLDVVDFELSKKGQPTGTVCVSVGVQGGAKRMETPVVGVGGELDHVLMSVALASQALSGATSMERRKSRKSARISRISLAQLGGARVPTISAAPSEASSSRPLAAMVATISAAPSEASHSRPLSLPGIAEPPAPSRRCSQMMPEILGSWKCVATQGLDEFLKKSGVGMFQRKIAGAARWPNWDFEASGETLLFVNHSAIGDLREEIQVGTEYQTKDGHGNAMTCLAEWTSSPDGGCLLITRRGSGMNYSEERTVVGDGLEFVLRNAEVGESWGRTFTRA